MARNRSTCVQILLTHRCSRVNSPRYERELPSSRLASPVSYKTHSGLTFEHLRRPLYPLVQARVYMRRHASFTEEHVERRMRCIAAFHARSIEAIITDIMECITLFLRVSSCTTRNLKTIFSQNCESCFGGKRYFEICHNKFSFFFM